MQIGVGLPAGIPDVSGQLIIEWARRADEGPFSSLGVVDRILYDSYEPLTTLAAAAAVTSRVQLATTIVIGPLHNTTTLARIAATIDALSQGRMVLGLALGARREDYEAAGVAYHTRAQRLNEQLAALRDIWEDERIGPHTARSHGPTLLLGGLSSAGLTRIARYTDGYIHGGGPPRTFARAVDKVRAAWSDTGRAGRPQLWAQGYFALGDDMEIEVGMRYMRDYYAFTGPFAERIAAGLLTSPQAIAQFLRGYEEAGCDEMVLFPAIPHLTQLERLASVLISLGWGGGPA